MHIDPPPSSSEDRGPPSERMHSATNSEEAPSAATPFDVSVTISQRPASSGANASPATLPDRLPAPFGRYLLLQQLGHGGMGAVYLARDSQLDRPVALKVPFFGARDGPRVRERFLREARAAAALRHANICPVYDVGEFEGVPYLTMAYIDGRSLATTLREDKKPLSPVQAAALVRKLALALAEAHRQQVIHRDLKPSNIILTAGGEPILMDFGLARRGDDSDVRLTQQGAVLGTPAYMAPEQARGDSDSVGPACDIYSLGVLLYELLTRRLPFTGETFALLARVLSEPPTPPSRHRPEIDAKIEAICLKAMAKEPAQRYPSMADFAAALGQYLHHAEPLSLADTQTYAPVAMQPAVAPASSKRRWALGIGAVLVLLSAGIGFALFRNARPTEANRPVEGASAAEAEVAYIWPAEALRTSKVRAPDFRGVAPLFDDQFDDPASGFPRGKGVGGGERGYRNGRYFIELPGRSLLFWRVPLQHARPAPPQGDFACQVTGRAQGRFMRWGLSILGRGAEGERERLNISIGNPGLLRVAFRRGVLPGLDDVSHQAIIRGANVSNNLLVIVRGRQLELYVNGAAVCDPVLLEHAIPSPQLGLLGMGGSQRGGTAEFERITIWPTDSVPALPKRGAVPKP